jgi:hypothetical protein
MHAQNDLVKAIYASQKFPLPEKLLTLNVGKYLIFFVGGSARKFLK